MTITVTPTAIDYIKKKISQKERAMGFRLTVKKTGCSGYAYAPVVIDKENPMDTMIEIQGIKFFLDTTWIDYLKGITIDYVEDNRSGLKQKKLVYINDKEGDRCGCGESFQIKQPDSK